MVLGDVNRTRRLAGNPASTNVSDADITQALAFGTDRAIQITGNNWTDTAAVGYNSVVTAVEYFASSYIRDRFQDQSDISSEHSGRANNILRMVVDSLSTAATSGTAIAVRQYRSYPLNNGAVAYRSMFSQGQQLVGVGAYNIPPSS